MDATGYRTTFGFIITVILMAVAFDIIAILLWGTEGSLSRVMLDFSKRWPIVPFALGVVAGHIFWPN